MRRAGALCLLSALLAGPATTVRAALATAPDPGAHHHPGCPWEARNEPCPHATPPAGPDAPAWAPCPPMEAHAPLAAGPDLAPPAALIEWVAPTGAAAYAPEPPGSVPDVPRPPDPAPPRGALAIPTP